MVMAGGIKNSKEVLPVRKRTAGCVDSVMNRCWWSVERGHGNFGQIHATLLLLLLALWE